MKAGISLPHFWAQRTLHEQGELSRERDSPQRASAPSAHSAVIKTVAWPRIEDEREGMSLSISEIFEPQRTLRAGRVEQRRDSPQRALRCAQCRSCRFAWNDSPRGIAIQRKNAFATAGVTASDDFKNAFSLSCSLVAETTPACGDRAAFAGSGILR